MSSHGSHGMPRYMCDDILLGSPYGLDFSAMAKARVIVAAPGCATAISARLTIPGRVGPVARHIGPQDHRVVDDPVYRRCGAFQDAYPLVSARSSVSTVKVTTEMHGRAARDPRRQGCNRGAVRGLRAVRRHTASTAGRPATWHIVDLDCATLTGRQHGTQRHWPRPSTPPNRRQPHGDRPVPNSESSCA